MLEEEADLLLGEEVGRDGEFPAGSHPRQTHPLWRGWVTLCLLFRVSPWERFLSFCRIFGLKARVCLHADFGNVSGAGALEMGFPSAGLIPVCIPVRREAA